jgi:putative methyltransferase
MDKTAYLPIATGLLCAYAKKYKNLTSYYDFRPFLFIREDPDKIVKAHEEPAVSAFSVSMWNEQLSLRIAERVKRLFPACLIIFGGPQVPHEADDYFREYPFVDITVRGDGETAFSEILDRFINSRDFKDIANISWRDPETGSCRDNKTSPAQAGNLDVYPSPYLEGLFEYLFSGSNDIQYQAIVETNRGCPYNCAYCVWGKGGLNKKLRFHSMERVTAELTWMAEHRIKYVFNADSNFGIDKRDIDIARFLAETKKMYGYPEKFRSCFAKNSDTHIYEIATLLYKNNLEKGTTLSFQSMNPEVLRNIGRNNIKLSTYSSLLKKFNLENMPVYTELILGLPGEDLDSWVNGIEKIFESELKGQLFIYPCEVYPNTKLSDPEYQKQFSIMAKRITLTETHGSARDAKDIREFQDIIVGSASMSPKDWRSMMIFSWMTMFLFSLKAAFFVLFYLKDRFGIKFVSLIEYICGKDMPEACSILRQELDFYETRLDGMLKGEGRCIIMRPFGNIYWDAEEASYLRISEKMAIFYDEMLVLLKAFLCKNRIPVDEAELSELVVYQRMRMSAYGSCGELKKTFQFNFPEYFESCLRSSPIKLQRRPQIMEVSRKGCDHTKVEFARETLLWGRKSNRILADASWHSVTN